MTAGGCIYGLLYAVWPSGGLPWRVGHAAQALRSCRNAPDGPEMWCKTPHEVSVVIRVGGTEARPSCEHLGVAFSMWSRVQWGSGVRDPTAGTEPPKSGIVSMWETEAGTHLKHVCVLAPHSLPQASGPSGSRRCGSECAACSTPHRGEQAPLKSRLSCNFLVLFDVLLDVRFFLFPTAAYLTYPQSPTTPPTALSPNQPGARGPRRKP